MSDEKKPNNPPLFHDTEMIGGLLHTDITLRDLFAAAVDIPYEAARAIAEAACGGTPEVQDIASVRATMRGWEADAMLREREKK